MPTLHIVVPFYEEPSTLEECLRRVTSAALPAGWTRNVTLVNDGSSAGASEAARRIATLSGIRLLEHPMNRGKGAAIRTGFDDVLRRATDDDAVLIQDADLEYDPADYSALVAALERERCDAVFGNRWLEARDARLHRRLHRALNRGLTVASNLLSGLRVGDMECCYKLFPAPILRRILPALSEERFGIEPQIAAALGRLRARVVEVPVRYAPRGFSAGKKIRPRDGLRALWVIARERFRSAR